MSKKGGLILVFVHRMRKPLPRGRGVVLFFVGATIYAPPSLGTTPLGETDLQRDSGARDIGRLARTGLLQFNLPLVQGARLGLVKGMR